MPALDRSTVRLPRCARCRLMHGAVVACPPLGVWLMAWSERVNGRRR